MKSFAADEDERAEQLAVGLGWFSLVLGVAELAAPRSVARLIGVTPDETTVSRLRGHGAREVATGLAILAQPNEARWMWGRVGGDALDLATLAAAMTSDRGGSGRLTMAAMAVLGVTALDVLCAQRLSANQEMAARTWTPKQINVHKAITINQPVERVYGFWRNLENLPRIMSHLEAVQDEGGGRSRGRAQAPGLSVAWDAETVLDRENEMIAWRSLEGAEVENSGTVEFTRAPGARGTEVHVTLQYTPRAGMLGHRLAQLFGQSPEQQLLDDLRRFKQVMETGEVTLSDGPALWRPAQPASNPDDVRYFAGV